MYEQMIRESMARQGLISAAPVHQVEAWMRCEVGTLDHLSRAQFDTAVGIGVALAEDNPLISEGLAESYGLRAEVAR